MFYVTEIAKMKHFFTEHFNKESRKQGRESRDYI